MARSLQEEIIYKLSHSVLGKHALFFPNRFGKNSEEPADLVWIVNRCAILMYMTAGNKRFERKRDHNLRQMGRWLKDWAKGIPLCGRSGNTQHSFSFADIDHIVGLSIVDDGEIWCEYHSDQVAYFRDHKLAACATLTGKVVKQLADFGAGARDLAFWLRAMKDDHRFRFQEGEVLSEIRNWMMAEVVVRNDQFRHLQIPNEFQKDATSEIFRLFSAIKHQLENDEMAGIIAADFRLSDMIWFSVASAALESQIADPGKTGPLVVQVQREADIYLYQCLTAAHTGLLKDNIQRVIEPNQPGLALCTAFDLGKGAPIRMIAVSPRPGPSLLQQELQALQPK